VTNDNDECEAALRIVLAALEARAYSFVTPTPATHRRVLARRPGAEAEDLRDVFGWSLAFRPRLLDPALLHALECGGLLDRTGEGLLHSRIRVSSLGGHLFAHSAFPTDGKDAVFFGPDSYRFAMLIDRVLRQAADRAIATIVDIGTGSGVGAVAAARWRPQARLIGTDVNAAALRLAKVNAATAGLMLQTFESDSLKPVDSPIDLALANPPYMIDEDSRDYRDGGSLGIEVALAMARGALASLSRDGMLVLYTGAPIVAGSDPLHAELAQIAAEADCRLTYAELDPDVFGEELDKPAYRDVERIAVVGAILDRRRDG
jgi:hypothetical protein